MNRGQLPARLLPTRLTRGDGPERLSGRITICRNTPSHIMSPTRSQTGSSAEVSLGVRECCATKGLAGSEVGRTIHMAP